MSDSADSLLERVMVAAEQRQFSAHTLTAYRRTWLKLIAWAAAEGLALETLPAERAGEFYQFATRDRSASHPNGGDTSPGLDPDGTQRYRGQLSGGEASVQLPREA